MGTLVYFPNYESTRFEPLREFIDDVEAEKGGLTEDHREELQSAIDHAWPGIVAIELGWQTKLLYAFAGFAIGFGVLPY